MFSALKACDRDGSRRERASISFPPYASCRQPFKYTPLRMSSNLDTVLPATSIFKFGVHNSDAIGLGPRSPCVWARFNNHCWLLDRVSYPVSRPHRFLYSQRADLVQTSATGAIVQTLTYNCTSVSTSSVDNNAYIQLKEDKVSTTSFNLANPNLSRFNPVRSAARGSRSQPLEADRERHASCQPGYSL